MRYASIRRMDITNGEGIGAALFVQGCDRHCRNCFNPETWDFSGGKEWTEQTFEEFMELAGNAHITRVSILGGEPLAAQNEAEVTRIIEECKKRFSDKKVWLWTGYMFEEVKHLGVMRYIDVLIDGAYEDGKRDLKLKWRGSSNQRVIDVQKSLQSGEIVLYGKD